MAMLAAEPTCRDARKKNRDQMGLLLIDAGQMYLARNKRRVQMGMHVINAEAKWGMHVINAEASKACMNAEEKRPCA
jgi:hypothetical protein